MRNTYRLLYQVGLLPWASQHIPPELVDLLDDTDDQQPAVAVDLGCGTGTQARYLASRGWQVTGIDFIPRAIDRARRDDPDQLVSWRLADLTDPSRVDPDGILTGQVRLLLDNGCLHGIPTAAQPGWAATVNHLAGPSADLLIRAAPPAHRWPSPAGISQATITTLLGNHWTRSAAPGNGWHRYRHHA